MSELKKYKRKLDSIFSKFIRLRDSKNGIGTCITCGRRKSWRYMDCGHYIKRQYLATRYDEKNCNIQCKHCNVFEQGANEKYKIAIDKKWGKGTSDMLEMKKTNKTKWTKFEYEVLIKHYQDRFKELNNFLED